MLFDALRRWSRTRPDTSTSTLPAGSDSLVELTDTDLRHVSGGADPRTLLDRNLSLSTGYGHGTSAGTKS